MDIYYILYLIIPLIGSFLVTPVIIFVSKKLGFMGREGEGRHIHKGKMVRLGGVIIFLIFWLAVLLSDKIAIDKSLIGVLVASAFLLTIGIIDDIKEISWKWQLSGQIGSILIVIAAGVGIPHLTNPLGGLIKLGQFDFTVLTINDIGYQLTFPADLFTMIWMLLIINTINWLDGLDGLASGVSIIGSFTLFFLSLTPVVNQPQTAVLALVLAGATFGFLFYNFSPAKIFLGTSGSMFLGFMLAALSIISGGKVATALLVLGFPIFDVLWVILQRWRAGVSIFHSDKRHFHHKLLEVGLSQRSIVLFVYLITATFGAIAILAQGTEKLTALGVLVALMILLGLIVGRLVKQRRGFINRN